MLEEFLRFKLINPLSFDLFSNSDSLLLEYDIDDYYEDLNDILKDTYIGDNLQSKVLDIFETSVDKLMLSLGIDADIPLRHKIDILEAIQVVSNIDASLRISLLDAIVNNPTNTETLEIIIGEYLKTDIRNFDLLNIIVTDTLIDTMVRILRDSELDSSELIRLSKYSVLKNMIIKKLDFDNIDIFILSVFDLEKDDEDKMQLLNFKNDSIGVILQKATIVFLSLDDTSYEEFNVFLSTIIDEEFVQQINSALPQEIERFK